MTRSRGDGEEDGQDELKLTSQSAPLLSHRNGEETQEGAAHNKSFLAALTDPTRELTAVEKLLSVVAVLFLLLASIFIGLFAGAKHRISTGLGTTTTITDFSTKTQTTTATTTATQVLTSTVPGPSPTSLPPSDGPCLTSECVSLASSMLGYLDTEKFDPCEDFVGFATNGWVKANPLPKSKPIWGSFNQVRKNNQAVILDILKKPIEIKAAEQLKKETPEEIAERENLVKLKIVFNDCLNEEHLDDIGTAPLLAIVDAIQDVFPAVYPKSTSIEATTSSWTSFSSLEAKARSAIDRLLNGEVLQATTEEATDVPPVEVSSKEPSRKTRLMNALSYLHAKDISALFQFAVEGDVGRDPQFQVLGLYQSATGLPAKPYYDEDSIVAVYEEVVASILAELLPKSLLSDDSDLVKSADASSLWPPFPSWPSPGPKSPDSDNEFPAPESSRSNLVKKLARQVVAFETSLARAGADPEDLFDPSVAYNLTPFEEVDAAIGIDLARYVSAFAPRHFPEDIIVTSPQFVKKMVKLVAGTEDHVLQAYFLIRAGLKHAALLGPNTPVRLAAEKLTSLLRGTKIGAEVDREEVCAGHVSSVLGHLVGAEFIKTQFPGSSKAKGEKIIVNIVSAFKERLETIDWMDEVSSKKAIDKANAITPKIGYPLYPDHKSPIALRQYYARTPVKAGDFFGDVVRATEADLAREWQSRLGNKRDERIWEMNADTVNAYFSPPDNEIVFPAGILQPPFFNADWPSYLQYGAFGAVAAHELAHAFDSTGSKFDDHGVFRQWWSNATVDAFEERAQCIAEQYSKFYVVGPDGKKVYVNGNLTNGENIGDFGLRFAWSAWKKASAEAKSEDKDATLPGLPFTHDQLFFLSFGRIWASTASPAQAVAGVRTDPHSPNQFRIEGALRNFPQFAETFKCPKGSRMNPRDRCELW